MTGTISGAGRSAAVEALRSRLRIDEYERRLAEERARFGRFQLASETERRVASLLEPMSVWGWTLLPDRRWPRTRAANVDLIHVGPGGVLVIDVKAWKEPRVEAGHLHNGQALEDDKVDSLLAVTGLVGTPDGRANPHRDRHGRTNAVGVGRPDRGAGDASPLAGWGKPSLTGRRER
jgi:hypothetical protein